MQTKFENVVVKVSLLKVCFLKEGSRFNVQKFTVPGLLNPEVLNHEPRNLKAEPRND
jgi:hypothetical protein